MQQGKVYASPEAALADITDGSVVLVSGFAGFGIPLALVNGLAATGVRGLTIVSCDGAVPGLAAKISPLVANGQVL